MSSLLASINRTLPRCWHSAQRIPGSASSNLYTDPVTELQVPS